MALQLTPDCWWQAGHCPAVYRINPGHLLTCRGQDVTVTRTGTRTCTHRVRRQRTRHTHGHTWTRKIMHSHARAHIDTYTYTQKEEDFERPLFPFPAGSFVVTWNISQQLPIFGEIVVKSHFTGCAHVGHILGLQHSVIPFVGRSLCRYSRLVKIFYFDCSTLYINTLCSENKYCLLFKLFYHVHGSSWSISASPKGKKTNCCFSRRKKGSIILMGRPSQAWQEQICFLFSISFLLLIFFLMCVNIKKYDRG